MSIDSSKPIALQWNQLLLDAICYTQTSPPLAARAMAMLHTAMYDAWTVYQPCAISTCTALYVKASADQCTKESVRKAFSYAAYSVLAELFYLSLPAENKDMFYDLMCKLGYDPYDTSLDISFPQGVGNLAAKMTIEYRAGDGSNPHGTLLMPAWSDYTRYVPVNTPEKLNDPDKWQPLKRELSPGVFKTQSFLASQWGLVKPFALQYNWQFRPEAPFAENDKEFKTQAQEIIDINACLTDEQKAIAEYWADGRGTHTPAGHWSGIAQFVLRNEKRNTPCIKLLFALSNALLDAAIGCWECKRYYNSIRPVSAIHYLFANDDIQAWAGPCKSTKTIKGSQWRSYVETPPSPEHVSEHSAFSWAAAAILKNFTGSDAFGACYVFKKGKSAIEPGCGIPCVDVKLDWPTFSDAAEQAGLSCLYGGTHFRRGVEYARTLGHSIGTAVWEKASLYFND